MHQVHDASTWRQAANSRCHLLALILSLSESVLSNTCLQAPHCFTGCAGHPQAAGTATLIFVTLLLVIMPTSDDINEGSNDHTRYLGEALLLDTCCSKRYRLLALLRICHTISAALQGRARLTCRRILP